MTTQSPDTAPHIGDYDALNQRVTSMLEAIRPLGPGSLDWTPSEAAVLIQTASRGVLRQLQEHDIQEAGTLAIRLGEVTRVDPFADLSAVAERYTDSQKMAESGVDANAQAQQARMALLANAAGETALAVVSSVVNPDRLDILIKSGRKAVDDYDTETHKSGGVDLLNDLLDQTEAAHASQEPRVA